LLYFKRNLPAAERVIRFALALALALVAVFLLPASLPRLLGLAGAASAAFTALVGFCPACALVGRAPVKR